MLGVLELVTDGREQVDEVLVVEPVEHPPAVASDGDEAQVSQNAQLLGDGVGRQLGAGGEFFDGELAAG